MSALLRLPTRSAAPPCWTRCGLDRYARVAMHSADLSSEAARASAFFTAARIGDHAALQRALAGVRDLLEGSALGWLRRRSTLLDDARLSADDVVQEVVLRCLRRPPENRNDARPHVALRSWAKQVARSIVYDALRRREDPSDDAVAENVELADAPDTELTRTAAVRQLERCGEQLGDRARKAFELIVVDPDLSALELAAVLAIETKDASGSRLSAGDLVREADALRSRGEPVSKDLQAALARVTQTAWQVRSLMLKALRDCMTKHGFEDLLSDGRRA